MYKDKISAQEITDFLALKASVSKRAAEEFLKVFIATVEDALLAGEPVKIKNFGTFKLQWNEPRKSVNVQTGEEIMLAGYSKVSFIPDVILKDLVNEPFAHLEPVELDVNRDDVTDEEFPDIQETLEPLRIFTEQATEIRSLLSEIQALSSNSKHTVSEVELASPGDRPEDVSDESGESDEPDIEVENDQEATQKPLSETDEQVSVLEIIPVTEEKPLIETEEPVEEKEITPAIEEKPLSETEEPVAEVEIVPVTDEEPLSENEETVSNVEIASIPEKKLLPETDFPDFKPELEILSTLINTIQEKKQIYSEDSISKLIEDPKAEPIGIPASVYTPNQFITDAPPVKKRKTWLLIPVALVILAGGGAGLYFFSPPVNEWVSKSFSGGLTPKPAIIQSTVNVVVPEKIIVIDSTAVEEPIDSLQVLFDYPRVYTDFIASEHIVAGSRLARMSQRYYGNSHFWVYIYEANKDKIPNPDIITPGTLIRIPRLDPRLIDASNPRCIQKASELHDLYLNK